MISSVPTSSFCMLLLAYVSFLYFDWMVLIKVNKKACSCYACGMMHNFFDSYKNITVLPFVSVIEINTNKTFIVKHRRGITNCCIKYGKIANNNGFGGLLKFR